MADFNPIGMAKSQFQQGKSNVLGSGGAPSADIAELDPGTKALIAQRQASANKTDEQIAAEMTHGAERGGEQLTSQQDMGLKDASLGMTNDPATMAAMGRRQTRGFENSMSGIQRQAMQEAPIERFNRLAGLTGMQAQANAVQFENYKKDWQAQQNRKIARNQVIGSVLGAAGTAGGAMIGGGAGARAGSQASAMGGQQTMGEM